MQELKQSYSGDAYRNVAGEMTQPGGDSAYAAYGEHVSEHYIALREKEKRIVRDDELPMLPVVGKTHPHYVEWQVRKRSCSRLLRYIKKKGSGLGILEVGCGNGWLSHQVSMINQTQVTGLDINLVELNQARRVFTHRANLRFVHGDLRDGVLTDNSYDMVVFAASIQYFSSLQGILAVAQKHLKANGQIYITDTMFYDEQMLTGAKSRSAAYFSTLGFPEMADFYFHHPINALEGIKHKLLYQPGKIMNRILGRNDPFHTIVINKGAIE